MSYPHGSLRQWMICTFTVISSELADQLTLDLLDACFI